MEAEKIYRKRENANAPCKVNINHHEFLWHDNSDISLNMNTSEESLRVCSLAHVLLNEYYLEGFNPSDGETIIDCGGAIGDTALFFNAFYPNSHIYTFECNDAAYSIMRKNIESNHKQNLISSYKNAVGLKDEKLHFENWSIVKEKTQSSVEVECISIDSFVRKHNVDNVGLIKMDIEGGEQNALKGAKDTITRFKPKLMIPIYHLENDIVEIPRILHSFGLKMEFRIKWVEIRAWNVDCILFVRFI